MSQPFFGLYHAPILRIVQEYFSDIIDAELFQQVLNENSYSPHESLFNPYRGFLNNLAQKLKNETESFLKPDTEHERNQAIAKCIHHFIEQNAKKSLWKPDPKQHFKKQVGLQEYWEGFIQKQEQNLDEKKPVEEVEPQVPLTRIDMIRYALLCREEYFYRGSPYNNLTKKDSVDVFSLQELLLQGLPQNWQKQVTIIDLNKKSNQPAKWAVLLPISGQMTLYCESELFEKEKQAIEEMANGVRIRYEGSTCPSDTTETTGYSVASFLQNEIFLKGEKEPFWSFNSTYDFFSFIQQYYYELYIGSNRNNRGQMNGTPMEFKPAFQRWDHVATLTAVESTYTFQTHQVKGRRLGETVTIKRGDFFTAYQVVQDHYHYYNTHQDSTNLYGVPLFQKPFITSPDQMEYLLGPGSMGYLDARYRRAGNGVSIKIDPNDFYKWKNIQEKNIEKITSFTSMIHTLAKDEHNGDVEAAAIATMIVGFFGISAKEKKLEINFQSDTQENFELSEWEKKCIIDMLTENPYVTELTLSGNQDFIKKTSLETIRAQNQPNFARNQWLKDTGYKPPLRANYWKECVQRSLLYLLDPNTELKENFQKSHERMGIKWLETTLSFLDNPDNLDWIEKKFGNARPSFYLNTKQEELQGSLKLLTSHFKRGGLFYFSEFDFRWPEICPQEEMLDFMKAMNGVPHVEKMVIQNVLESPQKKRNMIAFLGELLKASSNTGFHFVISIPEVDQIFKKIQEGSGAEALDKDTTQIISWYQLYNDIVLNQKRHECFFNKFKNAEQKKSKQDDEKEDLYRETLLAQEEKNTDDECMIDFGSGVAGKQQEQQIQQHFQQQIQIQQTISQQQVLEYDQQGLSSLVTYDNIQTLLLHEAKMVDEIKNDDDKKPLQILFEEWIGADHETKAPYIISKMTIPAAKKLFQNRKIMHSGLNPDNLPEGFFIQQDKENSWVLCYERGEIEYVQNNPFCLRLDKKSPISENWEGDFRLFQIDVGSFKPDPSQHDEFSETDWSNVLLFYVLQPKPFGVERITEIVNDNFMSAIQKVLNFELTAEQKNKIKNHPHVALTFWKHQGDPGINAFLQLQERDLAKYEQNFTSSSVERILNLYAAVGLINGDDPKKYNEKLNDIFNVLKFYENPNDGIQNRLAIAWGQVYYRFGKPGLEKIIEILSPLTSNLGLLQAMMPAIASLEDFSVLVDPQYQECLRVMGRMTHEKLKAWQTIVEKHFKSCEGWSSPEALFELWDAFEHLTNKLEEKNYNWNGKEFSQLEGNMLVLMNRMYTIINSEPDEIEFLLGSNLNGNHFKHAGLYYAVQYEKFKTISDEQLSLDGHPVYAKKNYPENELETNRALALRFNKTNYHKIKELIKTEPDDLPFLLAISAEESHVEEFISKLSEIDAQLKKETAKYFKILLTSNRDFRPLPIKLESIQQCFDNKVLWSLMIGKDEKGVLLVLQNIWNNQMEMADSGILQKLIIEIAQDSSDFLNHDLIMAVMKFIAQFGCPADINQVKDFLKEIQGNHYLEHAIKYDIFPILSSVDVSMSKKGQHTEGLWHALTNYCTEFKKSPNDPQLKNRFNDQIKSIGMKSTFLIGKNLRHLTDEEKSNLKKEVQDVLGKDYAEKLTQFIAQHFLVTSGHDEASERAAKIEMNAFVVFFKQLHVNQTEIDEVVPLLAYFSNFENSDELWSMSYWNELIALLKPEKKDRLFPISLLTTLLKSEPFAPVKKVENARVAISDDWKKFLYDITHSSFPREEQTLFCEMALKSFENLHLIHQMMELFSQEGWRDAKNTALNILLKLEKENLKHAFETLQKTYSISVQANNDPEIKKLFEGKQNILMQRWLAIFSEKGEKFNQLFSLLKQIPNQTQQSLVFYIMAFAEPERGNAKTDEELKTIAMLSELDVQELTKLAKLYQKKPHPTLKDLRNFCQKPAPDSKEEKDQKHDAQTFDEKINDFKKNPFVAPRPDHAGAHLSWTPIRRIDLDRMLQDYLLSPAGGAWKQHLNFAEYNQIIGAFFLLKSLEAGKTPINGVPLSEMNPEQLKDSFDNLCDKCKNNTATLSEKVQLLAIMAEALYKTTGKYPTMAQQIAFLSFMVLQDEDCTNHVLQLATGEGKSHFLAFRALFYAGQGYRVHVNLAKESLAWRDLKEYADLFHFFDLNAGRMTSGTTSKEHKKYHVLYGTLGQLSLAMDQAQLQGDPIDINPDNSVGLFDEIDFIYEEGLRTQFNYSKPTGRTSKQVKWFYDAIWEFHTANQDRIKSAALLTEAAKQSTDSQSEIETAKHQAQKAAREIIVDLNSYLKEKAGGNKKKMIVLKKMAQSNSMLAYQLEAAHQASQLQIGQNFTVRSEKKKIGEEVYTLKTIVPLSSDNQPQVGSTYSNGVHQMLAIRLNHESRNHGGFEDYDIVGDSNLISSQTSFNRIKNLWRIKEGASGTMAQREMRNIFNQEKTMVLHAATNWAVRRENHIEFCSDEKQQKEKVIQTIRKLLEEGKSILLACDNDAQVKEYETILQQANISRENLLFHTNADPKTPGEILEIKNKKENKNVLGQKNPVCLVASGFGRGDNVEVDAVILLKFRDSCDRLQKIGRTARAGQKGVSFEFYVRKSAPDDKEEDNEKILQRMIDESESTLGKPDEDFYLHEMKAQFSDFSSKILSETPIPEASEEQVMTENREKILASIMIMNKKIDSEWRKHKTDPTKFIDECQKNIKELFLKDFVFERPQPDLEISSPQLAPTESDREIHRLFMFLWDGFMALENSAEKIHSCTSLMNHIGEKFKTDSDRIIVLQKIVSHLQNQNKSFTAENFIDYLRGIANDDLTIQELVKQDKTRVTLDKWPWPGNNDLNDEYNQYINHGLSKGLNQEKIKAVFEKIQKNPINPIALNQFSSCCQTALLFYPDDQDIEKMSALAYTLLPKNLDAATAVDYFRKLEIILSCIKKPIDKNDMQSLELIQLFSTIMNDAKNETERHLIYRMIDKTKESWNYKDGKKREEIIRFLSKIKAEIKEKGISDREKMLTWSLSLPGRTQWMRMSQILLEHEPAVFNDDVKKAYQIENAQSYKKLKLKKIHFMHSFVQTLATKINHRAPLFNSVDDESIIIFGLMGNELSQEEIYKFMHLLESYRFDTNAFSSMRLEMITALLNSEKNPDGKKNVVDFFKKFMAKITENKHLQYHYSRNFENLSISTWEIFLELSKDVEKEKELLEFFKLFNHLFNVSQQHLVDDLNDWMNAFSGIGTSEEKRKIIFNVFKFFDNKKRDDFFGLQPDKKKMIINFFLELKRNASINDNLHLHGYFSDFSKNAEDRVLLMKCMRHDIFGYPDIFKEAFDFYEEEFNRIEQIPDLKERHQKIISLNEEMKYFSSTDKALPKDSLKAKIEKELGSYERMLFKAKEREDQFEKSKEDIDKIFAQPEFNIFKLLETVNSARALAMASDLDGQKNRILYMNRDGSSRYLKTLDKIENLILLYAHHEFNFQKNDIQKTYSEKLQDNMDKLSLRFYKTVESYSNGITDVNSSEGKQLNYKMKRLFLWRQTKNNQQQFCTNILKKLNDPYLGAIKKTIAYLESEDAAKVLPTLPGDIKTVLDIWLLHATAFVNAHEQKKNIENIKKPRP